MKTAAICGVILLAAAPAVAQSNWTASIRFMGWTYLTTSADEGAALFERPAVQVANGYPRIWARTEYRDPQNYGQRLVGGMWRPFSGRSTVWLQEFDCASGRSRILQLANYALNNMVGEYDFPAGPWQWSYSMPGTFDEILMKTACAGSSVNAAPPHRKN